MKQLVKQLRNVDPSDDPRRSNPGIHMKGFLRFRISNGYSGYKISVYSIFGIAVF